MDPNTDREPVDGARQDPQTVVSHLAQAEAAIMLVEALMTLLVERRILSKEEVVETIETVMETKRQMAAEGLHPQISTVAAGLLSTITNSIAAVRAPAPGEGQADGAASEQSIGLSGPV